MFRFWSFQILACSMPSIIFVIYSGHKAREKSKLESEAKKRQKERAHRSNPERNPTQVILETNLPCRDCTRLSNRMSCIVSKLRSAFFLKKYYLSKHMNSHHSEKSVVWISQISRLFWLWEQIARDWEDIEPLNGCYPSCNFWWPNNGPTFWHYFQDSITFQSHAIRSRSRKIAKFVIFIPLIPLNCESSRVLTNNPVSIYDRKTFGEKCRFFICFFFDAGQKISNRDFCLFFILHIYLSTSTSILSPFRWKPISGEYSWKYSSVIGWRRDWEKIDVEVERQICRI